MKTLTLQQAQQLVADAFGPGPEVVRPTVDALGAVLAQDLTSDRPFPPFDRIAMDGYAVRAADTVGASEVAPVRLRVQGTAAAGDPFSGRVEAGEATKAMTGAPLPDGADAVVPIEATGGWSAEVAVVHAAVHAGDHVARRGEDLAEGDVVLRGGTRLEPRHLQAALSAGWTQVRVVDPPRVAVLATGDELVPAAQTPSPAQIRESNGACVRAVLGAMSIPCDDLGIVPDDPHETKRRIQSALDDYEIVVLSGGVSKGERDLVKPTLRECGVELRFESLRLKPGHPTTYGQHPGGHVFALPGNPVAVFVTLHTVFGPGLRRRLGLAQPELPAQYGRLGFPFRRRGSRPQWLPVRLLAPSEPDLPVVKSTGHHGSGDFVSLARADALAWFPEDRDHYPEGDVVRIQRLSLESP